MMFISHPAEVQSNKTRWSRLRFGRASMLAVAMATAFIVVMPAPRVAAQDDAAQNDAAKDVAAQNAGDGMAEFDVEALMAEQQAMMQRFADIQWQDGPAKVALGSVASIDLPAGYSFTAAKGAQDLLELYGNPRNSAVQGAIVPEAEDEDWTMVFQFQDIGYVDDSQRDELDADALIEGFRAGIDAGNSRRRAMGAEELQSMAWAEEPFYDPATNNLTWALDLAFPSGHSINYDIRLLGRRGVMEVTLVGDPETYAAAVPKAKAILENFSFNPGSKYAEWKQGDKVAAIGLTGLVAGGVAVAAAKTGLLAKIGLILAKGGKAIAVAVIALVAGVGSFLKRLVGGGESAN